MNTLGWVFGVLCFCGIMAVTPAAQGVDRSSALEIVSLQALAATALNAHERQVEALVTTREPDGRLVASTNTAVVLFTGQHYLDSEGQWRESRPEITAVAEGFVAAQGPTRGSFSSSHPTLWNQ